MSEPLIVELDARTAKLDKALNKSDKNLNDFEKNVSKTDKSLAKLTSVAGATAKGLTVLGTAGLAVATAMTAVILNSAKANMEIEQLSRQAKLSTDDFEALAFATKQYGINTEQVADISKDIADKLGEFSKAGTGAFQDFADVVGLTKEQAMQAAREFENMSSDQVIGEMVRQMEAAGASSNQMTFALESMGNDLSKLTPLFADNSSELKTLTQRYAEVNRQLSLTSAEAEGLQSVATSFDLMTESMGNAGELISAQIAPLLDEFFNGVIDVVPQATQTIVDFINSFKDAETIKSVESMNRLIEEQKAKVQELRMAQNELGTSFASMFDSEKSITTQKEQLNLEIEKEVQRIDELIEARDKLTEQEEKAKADSAAGGSIGGSFDSSGGTGTGDQIAAIENRFKTEEQLLLEKFTRELEIIGENDELKLQLEQEYQDNLKEIRSVADQDQLDAIEKMNKADADAKKRSEQDTAFSNKTKQQSDENYLNAAMTLGNAFFDDNKAIKAGLVTVDTAAGISKAFAELPYPAALAASASIAATGIAQLATINGASKGGGSTPSTSASAVDQSDQSSLSVSETAATGETQTVVIKFEGNDSEIAQAIFNGIEQEKLSGNIG